MPKFTPKQRLDHVNAWQASGLTQTSYALQNQINPKTFASWVKNIKTTSFASVIETPVIPVQVQLEQTSEPVSLQLANCTIVCHIHQLLKIIEVLELC